MPAQRNEQKRNDILCAAFDLLSDPNSGKVSLSDIAAASGINKSLLQHYFPQKQHMVEVMLRELLEISFGYMGSEKTGNVFQQISDFNMLFFKAVSKNRRFGRFISITVSEPGILDVWIDIICHWLRDICDEDTFSYLQLKTALSFSMTGSMYLFLHKDELNIDYRYFCENHIRSILKMLGFSHEVRDNICERTRNKTDCLDVNDFLQYCRKNISFFCI